LADDFFCACKKFARRATNSLAKPVARHLSARRSLGEGGRLWEPAGVSPGRNVYLRKIAVDQIVEDY